MEDLQEKLLDRLMLALLKVNCPEGAMSCGKPYKNG